MYKHIYMHTYMHIYVYIYIYIHIFMYTHVQYYTITLIINADVLKCLIGFLLFF